MKLHFFYTSECSELGFGDNIAINQLCSGLKELGHQVTQSESIQHLPDADHVFLSNIYLNLIPKKKLLDLMGISYHLIPFYEDVSCSVHQALAFFAYQFIQLKNPSKTTFGDFLKGFSYPLRDHNQLNQEVVEGATSIFTNSDREKSNILKEYPEQNIFTIPWAPGQPFDVEEAPFTQFATLQKKGYILQVGRLEPRKNQLASILATQKLDIPLVLLSSHIFEQHMPYAQTCIEWAKKGRNAPVIILSQSLPAMETKNLRIIHLDAPLSPELLLGAYKSCSLHLHPAFYELPGFTALESAKLGIPTITSFQTTLHDYFAKDPIDSRIQYIEPTDIGGITAMILQNLGKTYPKIDHPSFSRTPLKVAEEFSSRLEKDINY